MVRESADKKPTHPGEILRQDFLRPMGITQRQLADAVYVPFQRINELVNGKRGVTPSTSLRLAKFFGVSEDFWMGYQVSWDLDRAKKKELKILQKIKPVKIQPAGKK